MQSLICLYNYYHFLHIHLRNLSVRIFISDDKMCNHEWIFDEIPGVQLYHYMDKTITDVSSSDDCMRLCLSESTFICRSAKFDATKSTCVLSQHDRRTAAEVFRQAPKQDLVLYLERQCGVEGKFYHMYFNIYEIMLARLLL